MRQRGKPRFLRRTAVRLNANFGNNRDKLLRDDFGPLTQRLVSLGPKGRPAGSSNGETARVIAGGDFKMARVVRRRLDHALTGLAIECPPSRS